MVKVSSPGPIFYRQRRVGLDGRHFEILKFRTMLDTPEAAEEPGENVAQAMLRRQSPLVSGDRRTPIGRWLRRLSLDELPQIINVVKGEMSLVGPRPERPSLAESFERQIYRYGERHRVKSGMTGWAQVHGLRGQSSLSDRAEWDNYYIENWSPWLDLKILLLTVPAMLRGDNDR
jgi:lipopolysaccharide/colanic/teichoic acid biosynthesis glycosyltransferase